jgi:hypothetical protein
MAKKQEVPLVVRRVLIKIKEEMVDFLYDSGFVPVVSKPCRSSIIKKKGSKYFIQPTWGIRMELISKTGGREIKFKNEKMRASAKSAKDKKAGGWAVIGGAD